ncbi:Prefoldin subunit-domain-containing protein [Sphaerosporella brunnea]|uniref:Prefoldin subunit 4 n=1 Tax=Sphaerosporella brunnea TaxID=1250544 RepID=A0A5J5EFT8_9PEZI|nr:Prefoldin subunit-domain-containing protein [Sphaerosporella brunnea]
MDKHLLSHEDEAATEIQVTRADQDAINRFSTLHQKQGLLQEELEAKRQEKEYLTDVSSELELADEEELVPYKIGDSFFHLPLEEVQELLEKSTARIEEEIEEIENKLEKHRETMEELKVELYAKFGKAINLDV